MIHSLQLYLTLLNALSNDQTYHQTQLCLVIHLLISALTELNFTCKVDEFSCVENSLKRANVANEFVFQHLVSATEQDGTLNQLKNNKY